MLINTTVKALTDKAMNLLGYTGQNGNERFTNRIMNKIIPVFNTVYEDVWHIEATPNNLMQHYYLYDPDRFKEFKLMRPRERRVKLEELCRFVPVQDMTSIISVSERAADAIAFGLAAFLAQGEDDSDAQSLWMGMYNKKRAGLTHAYHVHDRLPRVWEGYFDLPYFD